MGFISILKKIGLEANKFDALIPMAGPFIHALTSSIPDSRVDLVTGYIADGLQLATRIVTDAEIAGQSLELPGPQKAKLAAPALAQLFLDLPQFRGEKPKDPAAFKAHAVALGGAIADLMNDFEG